MTPDPLRATPPGGYTPICRNVSIAGRRTSIRMEPVMWLSLHEICERERLSVNDICALIDQHRGEAALTAALRVFIISYFRQAMRLNAAQRRTRPAPRADRPAGGSPLLTAALAVFGPAPG